MRRRESIFSIIIKVLFGLSIAGFVLSIMAVSMALPIVIIILIVLAITSLFKKKNDNKKVVVDSQDLLNVLSSTNIQDNRIMIDDTTYLLLTNPNDCRLDNIDIYMYNEYVGSLSEFSTSYPNAFNKMSNQIIKSFKKNKNKKNEKENIVQEVVKEIKKDCSYYIDRFIELNDQIEVLSVKDSISNTICYLREIKKVEDEFGDSKNKTRKLYEYYLPMYVDILANYDRLHDNAPESDEFKQNEEKLIKTSNLINNALKSITSSLMESYYTDLNVNMKTLESILKKDGLIDEDMEVKNNG